MTGIRITCPHCKGSLRMSAEAAFGPCLWCEATGTADRETALHYAEISRQMALYGVLYGEMTVERADALRREADDIVRRLEGRPP